MWTVGSKTGPLLVGPAMMEEGDERDGMERGGGQEVIRSE